MNDFTHSKIIFDVIQVCLRVYYTGETNYTDTDKLSTEEQKVFDETWRWVSKGLDLYSSRLYNQTQRTVKKKDIMNMDCTDEEAVMEILARYLNTITEDNVQTKIVELQLKGIL